MVGVNLSVARPQVMSAALTPRLPYRRPLRACRPRVPLETNGEGPWTMTTALTSSARAGMTRRNHTILGSRASLIGAESFGRYEAANLPHRVIDLEVECALPQLRR